ncbi:MAG: PHP domain-containing protein [Deltaproteobacteria bacterium]|nr:MAG: PHP domain-containing protein [Deltaproteobacteria bacterium]RPJ42463.1 MAG: PHP domain-containing protein [Deltaproteobacteria bacterium]
MRNLREFHADLHIHTCLSPCASLDLSPRNIVDRAKFQGLDVIAITDHNTAKNVQVVMRLGEKGGIKVIPGMEVQSREEIHLLTLFPDWPAAASWAEEVFRSLPEMNNDPLIFGDQPIVDEDGNILEFESRLLLNSLRLSAEEIIRLVAGKGGLTIPSHFDRGSFSLLSQLGFIPPNMPLEALEVSRSRISYPEGVWRDGPRTLPLIASSDAHRPEEIGSGRTIFLMAEAALDELRLAFRNQEGRRLVKFIRNPIDP